LAVDDDRSYKRAQLRLLDNCLAELEEAHVRGDVTVSASCALKLQTYLPGIGPGMLISEAIKLALHTQEKYITPVGENGHDSQINLRRLLGPFPAEALEEADARSLTEQIKSASQHLCMLLLEAHERRAWIVLGYETWEEYVHTEFSMSRSRSYEILDQARVIRAVASAANLSAIPSLSPYAASRIKHNIVEIVEMVRLRAEGASQEAALKVVEEILSAERDGYLANRRRRLVPSPRSSAENSSHPVSLDGGQLRMDLKRLRSAIESLATMAPVADVIAMIRWEDDPIKDGIDAALQWLTEFAVALAQATP
jgi:hypothetical protein